MDRYRRRLDALERRLGRVPGGGSGPDPCAVDPALFVATRLGFPDIPAFHQEWFTLALTTPRLCVVAPRGHGKSFVLTVALTAWSSIYSPGTWTYVFAQTGDQAENFDSGLTRR